MASFKQTDKDIEPDLVEGSSNVSFSVEKITVTEKSEIEEECSKHVISEEIKDVMLTVSVENSCGNDAGNTSNVPCRNTILRICNSPPSPTAAIDFGSEGARDSSSKEMKGEASIVVDEPSIRSEGDNVSPPTCRDPMPQTNSPFPTAAVNLVSESARGTDSEETKDETSILADEHSIRSEEDSASTATCTDPVPQSQNSPPPSPTTAIDLARKAAREANSVIESCRSTIQSTAEAVEVAANRQRTANKLADNDTENSLSYRNIARFYESAAAIVMRKASTLERKVEAAEAAADAARNSAYVLSTEVGESSSASSQDKTAAAYWAANTASSKTVSARKAEYWTLKAIRECWVEIRDRLCIPLNTEFEDRIYGANCNQKNRYLKHVAHTIVFIVGCILLVLLNYFKFAADQFIQLSVLGIFFVSWPILAFFYETLKKYCNARKKAERKHTKEVLRRIDERLRILVHYFENNGITLDPSDSDEEETVV